jgi:hypothetical protein
MSKKESDIKKKIKASREKYEKMTPEERKKKEKADQEVLELAEETSKVQLAKDFAKRL